MNSRTPRVWNGVIRYELTQSIAEISLANPIQIPADSYHSFFIHSSLGLRFTMGTAEGNIHAKNADLVFSEGSATNAKFGDELC